MMHEKELLLIKKKAYLGREGKREKKILVGMGLEYCGVFGGTLSCWMMGLDSWNFFLGRTKKKNEIKKINIMDITD